MVGALIQMKVAVLRHSLRVEGRTTWMALGGAVGAALAFGTIALGTRSFAHPALAGDLLAAAFAGWLFGWLVAAVFTGGSDETLRPEYFTMLPIAPRRLAASLLGAAVIGVAPLMNLVAFTSLVVYAARFGVGAALVAIPATLLELAFVILAARVVIGILGAVIHSRLSAALAAFTNALIAVLCAQSWVVIVAAILQADRTVNEGLPSTVSTTLRALPSGWGVVAVDAAGRGNWLLALGALLGLTALIGLLLLVWSALLVRRTTTTPTGQTVRSGASLPTLLRNRLLPATGTGAVVTKELSSWSRDLMRVYNLSFALCYALLFCLLPLLLGSPAMLPFVGALVAVMAAASSANLYGFDGSALWLTVMTPDVARTDVRGRQWAWLLTVAPISLVLTVVLTAASGQVWAWAWVLALVPALLGGGAGLVPLLAVVALVPGTDPHKRGNNPLSFGENEAGLVGLAYLMLVLVPLTTLPAIAVVTAGLLNDNAALLWSGVPVGIASGVLCAWLFGRIAYRRLEARGPELLQLMRVGVSARAKVVKAQANPLPRGKAFIVTLCWSLCWLPLFPQGIVPLVVKVTGSSVRSWFLALYLPPIFQWPVIFAMIALGSAMLYAAIAIQREHDRKAVAPKAEVLG